LRAAPYSARTPALGLLTDYIDITEQEGLGANDDLQHVIVSHFYDLIASPSDRRVTPPSWRKAAACVRRGCMRSSRIAGTLDHPNLSVDDACSSPRLHAALHPKALRA